MNKKFVIVILLILAILAVAAISYLLFGGKKAPDGATIANEVNTGDAPADDSAGSVDLVRPPFLDE